MGGTIVPVASQSMAALEYRLSSHFPLTMFYSWEHHRFAAKGKDIAVRNAGMNENLEEEQVAYRPKTRNNFLENRW